MAGPRDGVGIDEIAAPIDADRRRSDCVGEMQRTGVVGDDETAA